MKFKEFLDDISEETVAGDIASVDSKLDMAKRQKHLSKGKRCKVHKAISCQECLTEHWDGDDDWE